MRNLGDFFARLFTHNVGTKLLAIGVAVLTVILINL